jgi:hypothetical protein
MSVSSFPNGFTAALPTLSQAMNTKNYKALCVQGTIYNLIIKDWHLKGIPKLRETKVKVKVRRIKVNLDVGHHGEVPNDVANDFIVKLWKIASHRRNHPEAVDYNDDGL